MPIIEYQCEKCKTKMERVEKFSDKPLIICPSNHPTRPADPCNGRLRKLISRGSFQLKGAGWTPKFNK